jgi:hypothetical protein
MKEGLQSYQTDLLKWCTENTRDKNEPKKNFGKKVKGLCCSRAIYVGHKRIETSDLMQLKRNCLLFTTI